jgi:hypothetical protein
MTALASERGVVESVAAEPIVYGDASRSGHISSCAQNPARLSRVILRNECAADGHQLLGGPYTPPRDARRGSAEETRRRSSPSSNRGCVRIDLRLPAAPRLPTPLVRGATLALRASDTPVSSRNAVHYDRLAPGAQHLCDAVSFRVGRAGCPLRRGTPSAVANASSAAVPRPAAASHGSQPIGGLQLACA